MARSARLLLSLGLWIAGCTGARHEASSEQIAAIQREAQEAAAREAQSAQSGAAATPGAASRTTPRATPPGGKPVAVSQSELEARAASVLPTGLVLQEVKALPGGSPYAVGIARATDCANSGCLTLLLLDLADTPPTLLASHEFEAEIGAIPGPGSAPGTSAPGRIERIARLVPAATGNQPVLLAELVGPGGGTVSACGWWVRPGGPTFVCAPKTVFASTFEAREGDVIERWRTDLPGPPGDAADDEPSGGWTGRVLRFATRGWEEAGSFRCLARPLGDVLDQVEPQGLSAWQREMVLRLRGLARADAQRLDTDGALAQLQDALDLDRCDAETWRLIGRLEYESGEAGKAAPALAVALGLAPSRDAILLDLADTLTVLRTSTAAGRKSWTVTRATLLDRPATRGLVARHEGEAPAAPARAARTPPADSPDGVALALYREWLRRAGSEGTLAEPIRRRVEQKIADLTAPPSRRR